MKTVKARGIVIKQTSFGEANRILTIFTHEYGIIKACAYGAKSIRSKNSASAQFLSYGDYILYKSNHDIMNIQSSEIIESFFSVQEDIVKLSLCVYMCDLTYSLINTDMPEPPLLSLLLNCIYALSQKNVSPDTVKAVFELKATAYAGYMPNLGCCSCGSANGICAFSCSKGCIVCSECRTASDFPVDSGIYHALKYIFETDTKKMFSFNASQDVMKAISEIAEKYAQYHTEKRLSSLDYYKKISC